MVNSISCTLIALPLCQDQQSVYARRKDGGQEASPGDLGSIHRTQAGDHFFAKTLIHGFLE